MSDLERDARELSTADLHNILSWQEALAEHYDENFDFRGYKAAQEKIMVIKQELMLRKRGQ